MKKILIQTYNTVFQNVSGGVYNRIIRTVGELKNNGYLVEYFNLFKTKVDDFDVLHIFMLDTSNLALAKFAKSRGKKVVISSIIPITGQRKLDIYWKLRKFPLATTYKFIFEMCDVADAIIAETKQEAIFLEKYYHVNPNKITVIPNGADPIISSSNCIFNEIGGKCEYALVVGRFDKNKNQLNVIKAMKNSGTHVVFIGGASFSEQDYYDKCKKEAINMNNVHLLGWVDNDSELLKSAYINAKVIVCPSYQETFGLALVEGMMSGAIPVVSNKLPILDYDIFNNCLTFNPSDIIDIKNKIEEGMTQNLIIKKEDIEKSFSWESVGKQHIELYEKI